MLLMFRYISGGITTNPSYFSAPFSGSNWSDGNILGKAGGNGGISATRRGKFTQKQNLLPGLVNEQFANWNITMLFMGKSTISMGHVQ